VIPGLLREMGYDPAKVLTGAGLDAAALSDPENRIPHFAMGRLLRECEARTGCPHFGLLAGQRMNLSHLGLPGDLMRYSATLRAALQTFVVYHHLNSQGMVTFLREEDGLSALGAAAIYHQDAESVDQIYDAFIALACNVMRGVCGSRWAPERVLFARVRPPNVGPYRRFCQAPCQFNAVQTALIFPAFLLERSMPEASPQRLRSLEERAQAIGIELIAQLRRALRSLLFSGKCSADEMAGILLMHRRTLNRRLESQGTTFQRVLDEVRFEVARQLLDGTGLPLTEIAASLGYAELSAFSRAFRRWSGAAPSRRRLMHVAGY
jgi:AraC-like DNA-binding protein